MCANCSPGFQLSKKLLIIKIGKFLNSIKNKFKLGGKTGLFHAVHIDPQAVLKKLNFS